MKENVSFSFGPIALMNKIDKKFNFFEIIFGGLGGKAKYLKESAKLFTYKNLLVFVVPSSTCNCIFNSFSSQSQVVGLAPYFVGFLLTCIILFFRKNKYVRIISLVILLDFVGNLLLNDPDFLSSKLMGNILLVMILLLSEILVLIFILLNSEQEYILQIPEDKSLKLILGEE